jgi:hypothetical protein
VILDAHNIVGDQHDFGIGHFSINGYPCDDVHMIATSLVGNRIDSVHPLKIEADTNHPLPAGMEAAQNFLDRVYGAVAAAWEKAPNSDDGGKVWIAENVIEPMFRNSAQIIRGESFTFTVMGAAIEVTSDSVTVGNFKRTLVTNHSDVNVVADLTDISIQIIDTNHDVDTSGWSASAEMVDDYIAMFSLCVPNGDDTSTAKMWKVDTRNISTISGGGGQVLNSCNEATPPPDPDLPVPEGEITVTYTFTSSSDGGIEIGYIVRDKDGNDVTDDFYTLTVDDRFLHKEVYDGKWV